MSFASVRLTEALGAEAAEQPHDFVLGLPVLLAARRFPYQGVWGENPLFLVHALAMRRRSFLFVAHS